MRYGKITPMTSAFKSTKNTGNSNSGSLDKGNTDKAGSNKDKDTKKRQSAVTPKPETTRESEDEKSLRPKKLKGLVGHEPICESLRILVNAAQKRKESVDHILFHGPPGLGKTTFAHIVANEMGSQIRVTSGPAIERQGDLAAILTNLKPSDVLFIDEIHRLNRGVEEILYPAMEDKKLDIVVGKGPSARSIRLKLAKFTLIGATTRIGLLSSPLRDRFGVVQRLDYFSDGDLSQIVQNAAKKLGVKVKESGADEIARRSRGTPRIALRLLRRVRDFGQVKFPDEPINADIAQESLSSIGVDGIGLDELDRKILEVIIEKFGGGPVGLSTVAAAVSEELDTISDVYEPFLMQRGLLKRTPRGRVATQAAYEHLGLDFKVDDQSKSTVDDKKNKTEDETQTKLL